MTTKQEYIDALECITKEYYSSTVRTPEEVNKFNSYLRLFEGLVDEHFEEKQETNIEHYYEYLSEVGLGGFALVNGRCTDCSDTCCSECDFSGDCSKRLRWLASTYIKKYNLTQFEYDLLSSHLCKCKFKNINALTMMKEKGYFEGIDENAKIEDILGNCDVIKND